MTPDRSATASQPAAAFRARRRLLPAAAAVALTLTAGACGFRPLYGDAQPHAAAADLSAVSVSPIPDRVGLLVRNDLIDLLDRGGPGGAAYRLEVGLREEQEGVAIERTSSITRYSYRLFANYVLLDAASGEALLTGDSRAFTAYNVADSQFATLAAAQDAEERAARTVATDIQLQLAVFFDTRRNGGGTPAPAAPGTVADDGGPADYRGSVD